ncbi:VWA domain-containing protein [Fluviicola sp. SGL-29]|nr:VWA domain-containing protein [Fluviicola sp. SGL-29]
MKTPYRILFTLLTGFCLLNGQFFAQDRNQKVRDLNTLVELMNAFSMCNQQWYFDAVQLQKALYQSKEGIKESYFYCSKTQQRGWSYYSGIEEAFHFPEITPNEQGHVPSYQTDYIPWLRLKERVSKLLSDGKIPLEVTPVLSEYMRAADNLFTAHTDLNTYVSEKLYRSDERFLSGVQLLERHQHWFEMCHNNSMQLNDALQQYFQKHLPPLATHAELQNGLGEIKRSMQLLAQWERLLYAGDRSRDNELDAQLRQFNEEALSKDSFYLSTTRGYGYLHSGYWLHTRYRTFYTSMKSTIYWFASTKRVPEPFLKPSQQAYNDFLRSYNSVVEDYNDYIELADGLSFVEKAVCCLSRSEVDTNQNVLLMQPRLLYQFEMTPTQPVLVDVVPEILSEDQALIHQSLPHHLVYLLDVSSSMNEGEKLSRLKENATYLVNIQRSVDHISIVTFSGKSETILQAVPCDRKEQITEKINRIQATGQTNVYEGFKTVKGLLETNKIGEGVNTVLILTDGEFTLTQQTQSIINGLQENGIGICFVYLGKEKSNKETRKLETSYKKMEVRYYDIHRMNLKEVLLKIATE